MVAWLGLALACAARPEPAPLRAAPAAVAAPTTAEPPASPPDPAPAAPDTYPADYSPPDLTGAPMPFSRWQGRVVLVNLWASWCPPCMAELPALKEIHATHAPAGLVVVGLAIDDSAAAASKAYLERELRWPVGMDSGNTAGPIFGTNELPTTLLYAPDGRLVWRHAGPLQADDPDLAAALAELLGG